MIRRALLVLALASVAWSAQPLAQDYPSRPIRVIATSSAGGTSDIFMRALADEMHKGLGQPIVIENRPGGAFNIGAHHSHEQQMRALAPIFEKYGVNFVLSGHEHNYQRTRPIRFTPHDTSKAHALHTKDRLVPGEFKVDLAFDGENATRANGIIYITTGAGGKYLYDPEYHDAPEKWVLPEDGNVAYTVKMVSDRHSLTVFDVERDEVLMRQIDQHGTEIDRIRVTFLSTT